MPISERMKMVFEESRKKGKNPPETTYQYDLHQAALKKYHHLELWEKIARSNADAVVNQAVLVEPYDRIIGRTYYRRERKVDQRDPDIDYNLRFIAFDKDTEAKYNELRSHQLVNAGSVGHIAWDWNTILRRGTVGIRNRCEEMLKRKADDEKACQFYHGVLIMLDALDEWNDKHVARLEELGMTEMAEICRRVPKYPARTFHEAVQAYFMQHIVVMKENPFGGNSPGRLDYYLWPYLEEDLAQGRITTEEAEDLIEELMVRIDERIFYSDGWGESVVVGGSHPNGASAVNPLSYLMVHSFMKYNITHPYFYIRLPKNPPADFVQLAAEYVAYGQNRAQILNDEAIITALTNNGVTESDAADYYCGGCMEVGIQGRTSDFLFMGQQNAAKLLELCMTGGYCLINKTTTKHHKFKKLADFDSFEAFYEYYAQQMKETLYLNFEYFDRQSAHREQHHPAYLISSMIDDCIATGRNMHGGGARYHDYGCSVMGIPNAADSLMAIKKAVFEDRICTAEELVEALDHNFEGYEELHRKLKAYPKYGQENEEADALARRISSDYGDIYRSYVNRFGGNCKLIMLSFTYAPTAGKILGATPDGRLAGLPVAQSVTPQSASMTKGITAAINSCSKLPFELFCGGASTMWDLDPKIATPQVIQALFMSLFQQGGHIFQGNVTDVEELKRAQADPEQYGHLIVRVGGYSARFVNLDKALQDEVINRLRHTG